MHIRETIMQNIKTTLEGIVSIGAAIPNAANSGLPNDLIVQTGGTYTHTAQFNYAVEVTTAGASGVAKVSVTGSEISGPHTVTSGTPITVGTKGVQVTFTFTGELIIGDKWTIKADIYENTLRDIFRVNQAGMQMNEFPSAIIQDGDQSYGEPQGEMYTPSMRVIIGIWVKAEHDTGALLNSILSDIEYAVSLDPSRGGLAFDTTLVSAEPLIDEEVKPFAAITIELAVSYKQVIG